ncbi:MAG: hypothetical protein JSS27_00915 [Planctomycetes bacterium]|nr:hypothetical protein [Planctomycetota bacterium]
MRRLIFTAAALWLAAQSGWADEPRSERARLADFLRTHLQDRAFITHGDVIVRQENREMQLEQVTTFSNVRLTERGLTFDITTKSTRTHRVIPSSDSHKPSTPADNQERSVSRTLVRRVELAEQKHTGHLVGFARHVKDSQGDPTGAVSAVFVEHSSDPHTAVLDFSDAVYHEAPGGEPISEDETISLRRHGDGTLELHQNYQFFSVDPAALQRSHIDRKLVGFLEVVSYEKNR